MRVHACALALALALGLAAATGAAAAPPPRTVSGVAEARVVRDHRRATLRLMFSASVDPTALRVEVIEAGQVAAVLWYDADRVLVLAPGEPPLLHEGPPTRATLEAALGLPFAPDDVFRALRGGHVGAAAAGEDADAVEVKAADARSGARLALSRWRRVDGMAWPHRAVLESDRARAVVDVQAVKAGALPPLPPSGPVMERARRVSAASLAHELGLAPAPATGSGTRTATPVRPPDAAASAREERP